MVRACMLSSLLVGGLVSVGLSAQPSFQTPSLRLEQLKDKLYVLHGGCMCGNTLFYIADGGVVMVDTKVAGQGEAILEQLRTVTDKPIAMIINTHTHFDHTGSNAEFGAVERIVAHENAKASLMKTSCPPVTNCDAFKGANASFLPNVTFSDTRSLTVGTDRIDLYYFGPGHTNGDTWIVFPDIRVAMGGDLFGAKGVPYIDVDNGGTAIDYDETVARAVAGLQNVDLVITGHVEAYPWDDLVRYAEFHRNLETYALAGQDAGKTAAEVVRGYTAPANLTDFSFTEPFATNFIQLLFDEANTRAGR
ncbi:MAG: MBL fold metallo-hydrolase [Acidobacteria bacterium]|nr:MBL fold metallo-hydrolase [Acidobacteriota bacterium]